MTLRDNRRDKGFHDAHFEEVKSIIQDCLDPEKLEKRSAMNPSLKCSEISSAARYYLSCVKIAYVRGDGVEEMRQLYRYFVDYLWQSEQCFQEVLHTCSNDINLTSLQFCMPAIAFGEGLGFGKKDLETVARCIPAGRDQLVDTVMAVYEPGRIIHDKLTKPGVYRKLLDVISAPKEKQAGLIQKYLNNWEKSLQKDGRGRSHEQPTYVGYWCYEAAAVVAAFDIDDSSFIDHEYYPSDLMRWRKG